MKVSQMCRYLRQKCRISCACIQVCQIVYFQTKNSNLGKVWRALNCWYILCILWQFMTIFGDLVVLWYIFSVLVNYITKNLATLHASAE
jgi:hypothetical protein